jgi:hypothetical protein
VVECVFAGGFAILSAQNVVKCVVNRGGIVVKVWLETPANRAPKYATFFEIFLVDFFAGPSFGLTSDPKEEDSWVG